MLPFLTYVEAKDFAETYMMIGTPVHLGRNIT